MKYLICSIFLFICCATTKYITIKSDPPGTMVEIDGHLLGRTPTTFWVKGLRQSISSLNIRAIPTDMSYEIIFVKKLLDRPKNIDIEVWGKEYIEKNKEQNINGQLVEHILSYLVINKGKGTIDELLDTYIDVWQPQYSQSKTLWNDEIFRWREDTLLIYFKMTLKPIPQEYEIKWK